jgi:hypothetical protein
MEASITNQPGDGSTVAETTNSNSNIQINPMIQNANADKKLVTLKEAAAAFDCAASSLKNNIKAKKLLASQAGEKSPFMVRLCDVDRFLRDTPGIASKFHPRNGEVGDCSPAPVVTPPLAATAPAALPDAPTVIVPSEAAVVPPSPVVRRPDAIGEPASSCVAEVLPKADGPDAPTPQNQPKRRRRRRGKGGSGQTSPPVQTSFVKALDGVSPEIRLKLTACLNELAAIVASA